MNNLTARPTKNAISTEAQPDVRQRAEQAKKTDPANIAAAGLYVAITGYDEALRHPDPVATLDNMCDGLAEITPDIARALKTEADAEFSEQLRAATVAPLWAALAIERARVEMGAGYGYLADYLADGLRSGADPDAIRKTALATPARIRELAEQATE